MPEARWDIKASSQLSAVSSQLTATLNSIEEDQGHECHGKLFVVTLRALGLALELVAGFAAALRGRGDAIE
jgi:hypothetical protein